MKVRIVKIWAVGSYKSFAYIELNDDLVACVRINRDVYNYLRENGVPTSQSLRKR